MTDLFNPALYANLRKPLLDAEGLPPSCYVDPAFYRAELDRIFHRGWHMVGRADRLPNAGDYLTASVGEVPLVVVRAPDGSVRAFVNACRHRGTPLVTGAGTARAFNCPYHAWSYNLDGALTWAGGMEQTHEFRFNENGLVPARLGTWGGFLFACVDKDTPDLSAWLGNLPERLAHYGFDEMVGTWTATYTVKCNWKLWVENFMEGYHVPTVHRSTLSHQKVVNIPEDPGPGQYVSIYERHEGTRALLRGDAGFPPIESLAGDSAAGSRFILIYPATMLAVAVDAAWSLVCDPLGPEETRVNATYCFPKSRLDHPDFAAIAQNYYKRIDMTLPEDNQICELQQIGLRSPLQRPGRFAAKEKIVHALDNWIVDRVLGSPAAAAAE